jgi:hypothetical protein
MSVEYAGREWHYNYRKLFDLCSESTFVRVSNDVQQIYNSHVDAWTADRNSAWTCRMYLCTKMILNATALVHSSHYASGIGLRIANPYFEYYAALSLARGVVFTLPSQEWNDGNLISITHKKAINIAFDWVARFDQAKAEAMKKVCQQLKAQRELISYKAPASGDTNLGADYNLIELLTILAEVAQFNSELLELAVDAHADPTTFSIKEDHIHQIATISIGDYGFSDDDDYRRLGYLARKYPRPYDLSSVMTAGQSEDFFGAWDGKGEDENRFGHGGPSSWQTIYDIP